MTVVAVRGRYLDVRGAPASGHVKFDARPAVVYDSVTNDFIVGQSRAVDLDGDGAFEVELRATDDPELQPLDWTYQVHEWVGSEWVRPAFDIDVPAAAADDGIELGEVAPIPASGGEVTAFVTLATFEALEDRVDIVEGDVAAGAAGLVAEAAARVAADTTEATTRAAADTAEATARAAGDAANAAAVTAEATARSNADTALAAAVAAEAVTRGTADTAEAAARIAGDATAVSTAAADATTKAAAAQAAAAAAALAKAQNLADVPDKATARTNLGTPALRTTLVTATGNGTYDVNPDVAAGRTMLRAQLQAGGTGAGSGRKGAAGTVRCAGGPGANGAFVDVMIPIADVLAAFPTGLVPYNVGPGTAGGAAVTTDDTNGNPGSGGVSSVNNTWLGASTGATQIAIALIGSPGAGGTNATGASAGVAQGTSPTLQAGNASNSGGAGVSGLVGTSGPGGGITSGDVPGAGAAGRASLFAGGVAGSGGVVGGAAPTSGTLGPALNGPGATPGGGAASITGNAQAGANALANSGAGGGSGGASLNGASKDSGAGGSGGSGWLRITAMG